MHKTEIDMSRKISENINTGYIAIFRSLRENWKWGRKPYSQLHAFLDILMEAEFENKEVEIGNDIVLVKRGQVYRSIRDWATRWGWHRSRVSRYFHKLQFDSTILIEKLKKQDILTIVKYDDYQFGRDKAETKLRQCRDNAETVHSLSKTSKEDDIIDNHQDIQYYYNNIYITQLKSLLSEWNCDDQMTNEIFTQINGDPEIAVLYLEKAKSVATIIKAKGKNVSFPIPYFSQSMSTFNPKIDNKSRKFARKIIKENDNRKKRIEQISSDNSEREELKKNDPDQYYEFLNSGMTTKEWKEQHV